MSDYLDFPRIDAPDTGQTAPVDQPRTGCAVKVWLEDDSAPGRKKRDHFHVIETEFADFATFLEFVEGDRLISGEWLFSRWSKTEYNVRIVHDSTPIAFRGGEVRRCELPTFRLTREAAA